MRTFLSANSSDGFYSYFNSFSDGKISYVIKGGPGTGKSGLMKKVAAKAVLCDYFTEYVYCSSDPDSLDGIYIHGLETTFTDGTPPHVAEPKYPGAMGSIIDVGRFLDCSALRDSLDEIVSLNFRISSSYANAYKYLKASGCLSDIIEKTATMYLKSEKLESVLKNIFEQYIKTRGSGGKRYFRFLSGCTPKGFVTFKDTIYTLCSSVCVLKDKYEICSPIIEKLVSEALSFGYDVYEFHSPLSPGKISHIAIPEADIAFVSSTGFIKFESQNVEEVNVSDFISDEISSEYNLLSVSGRLMKNCLNESFNLLKSAKAFHDDLEDIYISAMDFESLNMLTERCCDLIK